MSLFMTYVFISGKLRNSPQVRLPEFTFWKKRARITDGTHTTALYAALWAHTTRITVWVPHVI